MTRHTPIVLIVLVVIGFIYVALALGLIVCVRRAPYEPPTFTEPPRHVQIVPRVFDQDVA